MRHSRYFSLVNMQCLGKKGRMGDYILSHPADMTPSSRSRYRQSTTRNSAFSDLYDLLAASIIAGDASTPST